MHLNQAYGPANSATPLAEQITLFSGADSFGSMSSLMHLVGQSISEEGSAFCKRPFVGLAQCLLMDRCLLKAFGCGPKNGIKAGELTAGLLAN
jgi:hypothetical protein